MFQQEKILLDYLKALNGWHFQSFYNKQLNQDSDLELLFNQKNIHFSLQEALNQILGNVRKQNPQMIGKQFFYCVLDQPKFKIMRLYSDNKVFIYRQRQNWCNMSKYTIYILKGSDQSLDKQIKKFQISYKGQILQNYLNLIVKLIVQSQFSIKVQQQKLENIASNFIIYFMLKLSKLYYSPIQKKNIFLKVLENAEFRNNVLKYLNGPHSYFPNMYKLKDLQHRIQFLQQKNRCLQNQINYITTTSQNKDIQICVLKDTLQKSYKQYNHLQRSYRNQQQEQIEMLKKTIIDRQMQIVYVKDQQISYEKSSRDQIQKIRSQFQSTLKQQNIKHQQTLSEYKKKLLAEKKKNKELTDKLNQLSNPT